jgi:hypothetical protein
MNADKVFALAALWLIANFVGFVLPVNVQPWISVSADVILLGGVGSIVLSLIFGGDWFDRLFAGFMLAAPGAVLMTYVFGWKATNLVDYCQGRLSAQESCGLGEMLSVAIVDLCVLAVGMLIVAVPALPVMWILHRLKG